MKRKQPDCTLKQNLLVLLAGLVLLPIGSCNRSDQPRLRPGAFFGSPIGIPFPDPNHLGTHNFAHSDGEKNGMVYTCRGGFIDIGHLREAADRTCYLTTLIHEHLMQEKSEFQFRVIEPSIYHLTVVYPPDWHERSREEKDSIAYETAVQAARYIAHISLIWHEILTWFGFASTGIFSENISSFSWEDPYSDLLGVTLATQVLRQRLPYNQAMTRRLQETLEVLGVQSPEVAHRAAESIQGKWYSGGFYFFVDMKRRNVHTGLGGGSITPWLVPGICPNARPLPLRAPVLKCPTEWGFEVHLEIYPVEPEKKRIYEILNRDSELPIYPSLHFPVLLEDIRRQSRPPRQARES